MPWLKLALAAVGAVIGWKSYWGYLDSRAEEYIGYEPSQWNKQVGDPIGDDPLPDYYTIRMYGRMKLLVCPRDSSKKCVMFGPFGGPQPDPDE